MTVDRSPQPANSDEPSSVTFGAFTLDLVERQLRRGTEEIALTMKAMDILLLLVAKQGLTIEKEEFMREVWPDAVVEEANLTDNISTLRQVLGDDARDPQYIRTIPRRGYRFIGEAKPVARVAAAGRTRVHAWRPRSSLFALAAVATLVLAALLVWRARTPAAPPRIQTLVVLPFQPLVAEQGDPALELGMTDAVISRLSTLAQIHVRPTTAVLKYRDADVRHSDVASELDADVILEGKVQKAGPRVRLSVQLVRVSDGATIWADRFDESIADILLLQDAISERAANALALRLSSPQREALARRQTTDVEAYQLYLNGRYLWQQFDPARMPASINYFNAAVARDPKFAPAWAGIAKSYNQLALHGDPNARQDAVGRSRAAAEAALRIDPQLAEAHVAVAARKIFHEWDWPGAERSLDAAERDDPEETAVHTLRGYLHLGRGEAEEGLRELRRGYEISPTWHVARGDLFWALLCARKLEEATTRAEEAIALNSGDGAAHLTLGQVLVLRGRHAEAIEPLEKAYRLLRERHHVLGPLAAAYSQTGRRGDALRLLDEAKTTTSMLLSVAQVYAAMGDADRAFEWLDRAFQARSPFVWTVQTTPELASLHADPRFNEFVQRFRVASGQAGAR